MYLYFIKYQSDRKIPSLKLIKGKGKVHPRTGHEGPEGE
jgi:hypothetical protein